MLACSCRSKLRVCVAKLPSSSTPHNPPGRCSVTMHTHTMRRVRGDAHSQLCALQQMHLHYTRATYNLTRLILSDTAPSFEDTFMIKNEDKPVRNFRYTSQTHMLAACVLAYVDTLVRALLLHSCGCCGAGDRAHHINGCLHHTPLQTRSVVQVPNVILRNKNSISLH